MNAEGKIPVDSEALITCVIAGVIVGAMDCKRLVGIGSRGHVVGRLQVRSLDTSISVRGLNEANVAAGLLQSEVLPLVYGPVVAFAVGSENCLLMAATLSLKKEAKESAVRLVAGGGGGGLSKVLKVENSLLVSVAF